MLFIFILTYFGCDFSYFVLNYILHFLFFKFYILFCIFFKGMVHGYCFVCM